MVAVLNPAGPGAVPNDPGVPSSDPYNGDEMWYGDGKEDCTQNTEFNVEDMNRQLRWMRNILARYPQLNNDACDPAFLWNMIKAVAQECFENQGATYSGTCGCDYPANPSPGMLHLYTHADGSNAELQIWDGQNWVKFSPLVNGDTFRCSNTGREFCFNGQVQPFGWELKVQCDPNPIGRIDQWPLATLPPGWILADGTLQSRVDCADLFAVYGEEFGAGDGSTTFGIPDYRGKTLFGANGSSIGLGASGGAETHTLTIAEMPEHDHSKGDFNQLLKVDSFFTLDNHNTDPSGEPNLHEPCPMAAVGGGEAHNNMPPWCGVNYIIFKGCS